MDPPSSTPEPGVNSNLLDLSSVDVRVPALVYMCRETRCSAPRPCSPTHPSSSTSTATTMATTRKPSGPSSASCSTTTAATWRSSSSPPLDELCLLSTIARRFLVASPTAAARSCAISSSSLCSRLETTAGWIEREKGIAAAQLAHDVFGKMPERRRRKKNRSICQRGSFFSNSA
ncbi:hypothetical protein VPH35_014006 [Triticum aestivum]